MALLLQGVLTARTNMQEFCFSFMDIRIAVGVSLGGTSALQCQVTYCCP
jgi:hypothetical protein